MSLARNITSSIDDVAIMLADESTRKLSNSQLAKPFICEKCGKSYRKQKFHEIYVKHG